MLVESFVLIEVTFRVDVDCGYIRRDIVPNLDMEIIFHIIFYDFFHHPKAKIFAFHLHVIVISDNNAAIRVLSTADNFKAVA